VNWAGTPGVSLLKEISQDEGRISNFNNANAMRLTDARNGILKVDN
jgi:hypothetical protein